MRCALKIFIIISVVGFLGASVPAVVPDSEPSQYRSIPERNVFSLRPPPAQPAMTNPVAPLPKITLTGVTTILGNKRALMKVAPNGLKPADPAKELSLILTEGQREGEIEVLQIDEKVGSVKVNNSGTIMLLTFEKDGVKLPAAGPGSPGLPPQPHGFPKAGGLPPNPLSLPNNAALRGTPPRTPRFPAAAATGLPQAASAVAPPVAGIPTPTGTSPTTDPEGLTAEEQAIISDLQRQANSLTLSQVAPTPLNIADSQPAEGAEPVPGANQQVPMKARVLVPQ
jgi:hypothetical protein